MRIILLKMNYGLWPLQASQNCFHKTLWPVPSPVPLETRGWGLSPTTHPLAGSTWHRGKRWEGQERVPSRQVSSSSQPGFSPGAAPSVLMVFSPWEPPWALVFALLPSPLFTLIMSEPHWHGPPVWGLTWTAFYSQSLCIWLLTSLTVKKLYRTIFEIFGFIDLGESISKSNCLIFFFCSAGYRSCTKMNQYILTVSSIQMVRKWSMFFS